MRPRLTVVFLGCIVLISLCASVIAPYDPMASVAESLEPASGKFLLGTDALGRDIWSRVLYGGRHTLLIATMALVVAVLPGLLIGIAAEVAGGYGMEYAVSLCINSLLSIPALMTALVIIVLLGQGSWQLALATGGAQIAAFARVTRAAMIAVRESQYVEGAQAIGAGRGRIILKYLLPNAGPTLFAYTGVVFSYCIINSAALSFLGLGGTLGVPDWGIMIAEGRMVLRLSPWGAVVPGLLIFLMVLSVNGIVDYVISNRR